MSDIENLAMRIFHAYEDFYLDKDKRKVFEDLFDQYLAPVDIDGKTEPYDALVILGRKHPTEFERIVDSLKNHSLLS